nr:hypothetical protein [Tatumella sp. OPLPL6]
MLALVRAVTKKPGTWPSTLPGTTPARKGRLADLPSVSGVTRVTDVTAMTDALHLTSERCVTGSGLTKCGYYTRYPLKIRLTQSPSCQPGTSLLKNVEPAHVYLWRVDAGL